MFSVIWVEVYDIGTDGVFALPVRDAEPAQVAIAKGIIKLITEEQAKAINVRFASQGEFERSYLEEKIAARHRVMDMQRAEVSQCQ